MSEGRESGVASVVVGSVFGAPQIFGPNRSETLQNKGLVASGLPTPHSWPSDFEKNVPKSPRKCDFWDFFFFFQGKFYLVCRCSFGNKNLKNIRKSHQQTFRGWLCVLPHRNFFTHMNKVLPPTQSRDNPPNLFMFMFFSRRGGSRGVHCAT